MIAHKTKGRLWLTCLMIILLSACAGIMPDQQAQNQETGDDVTALKVKTQLIESDLDAAAINVETRQGATVLEGFVETEEQRKKAEQVAQSVAGVKSVTNNIEVKGKL